MQYKQMLDRSNAVRTDMILKIDGEIQSFVPCDTANRDYQEYLAWVAEGNVIEEIPLPPAPEDEDKDRVLN